MTSMLVQLLYKDRRPLGGASGRRILFDKIYPSIDLLTGRLAERVEQYLRLIDVPVTAADIAQGIDSNASQVTNCLKTMIRDGLIIKTKIDGCVAEYSFSNSSEISMPDSTPDFLK